MVTSDTSTLITSQNILHSIRGPGYFKHFYTLSYCGSLKGKFLKHIPPYSKCSQLPMY